MEQEGFSERTSQERVDRVTAEHPKAKLYYLTINSGLTFSQAALRDVRTILKNSEAVPAARLKEAEKAMHTLLEAAEASKNIRLTASKNSKRFASRRSREAPIRSADVYAGLKSICPLWPFC
jgi:hypothetical protein